MLNLMAFAGYTLGILVQAYVDDSFDGQILLWGMFILTHATIVGAHKHMVGK